MGQDKESCPWRGQTDCTGSCETVCGTRGTGKTTVAKIFAKAVNCEHPVDGSPCGTCEACRAIAAGKVAAANIDEQLGFHHEIRTDVEIPAPHLDVCPARGRVNTKEREAARRKYDFEDIECGMTHEEACAESGRCLRCDHFGYGIFKGGRTERW